MNLIHQFPDISKKMRDKLQLKRKDSQRKSVRRTFDLDKELTKFYDNEFRKWHIKLIFIIALSCTALYMIILNFFGFYQWIIK